jgi:hypothetical protein
MLHPNPNPNPSLAGARAQKEIVRYQRADGLDLNATLYLPPGYQRARDGRLPCLLWAYPREYKSRARARRPQGRRGMYMRFMKAAAQSSVGACGAVSAAAGRSLGSSRARLLASCKP